MTDDGLDQVAEGRPLLQPQRLHGRQHLLHEPAPRFTAAPSRPLTVSLLAVSSLRSVSAAKAMPSTSRPRARPVISDRSSAPRRAKAGWVAVQVLIVRSPAPDLREASRRLQP